MSNLTQQILQEVVNFINATRDGESSNIIESYITEIKKSFLLLNSEKLLNNFYEDINDEFQDDPELHVLLLSVICKVVLDERSIIEIIGFLCQEKIDLFTSLMLRSQIENLIFTNSKIRLNYKLRRELHKSLLLRLEKVLDIQFAYKPFELRNDNRIVIVTNQWLSDFHAPTNLTKEICYVLQKNLGLEVLLIVAFEELDINRLQQTWFEPSYVNYYPENNGNFMFERYGEEFSGYQVIMSQNNLMEIKQLIEEVYNYNPFFIWYMGNLTLFADMLRNFTTVVAMPFTDGYAISEASIMLSYMNSHSLAIKEMEIYLKENNQVPLNYEITLPLQASSKIYKREDYGLEEDKFLITIIGNRLDAEITEEFIVFLKRVLQLDSRIILVFIGLLNKFEKLISDEVFKNRIKYIGFQDDLIGITSMMDLFLNPPRQGGGTGAVYCLFNGIPVVTLDFCDVANFIDKEDRCMTEEDMLSQIEKYLTDRIFYEAQSNKGRRIQERFGRNKAIEDNKLLIENVVKIIQHKENPYLTN